MRLLHTMLRVGDLETSIHFYTQVLGMQLLRRKDYPDGKFTLAFIGYGDESENTVIELTHNWGTEQYNIGDGYGHIAVEVDDVYKATDAIKQRGGKIIRDAWVFGLIPETETCEGWNLGGIDSLLDQVNKEWDKYGCMVSHLPEDLRKKHQQFHDNAIAKAKAEGWSGEVETDDET